MTVRILAKLGGRVALVALVALGILSASAPGSTAPSAAAASACTLDGRFAPLQAQLGDRLGTCTADALARPEMGELSQATTAGRLVSRALDSTVSFSDGAYTWVVDPAGQVQTRDLDQRFPFEFNGDGLPLVGQDRPATGGPCPTDPIRVVAVENFYASLVTQLGGQCVQVTTILSDPDADPHEFQPTAADARAFHGAHVVVENGLGYDDFADKILNTQPERPLVVRAGDVLGLSVGANPHVWYSPTSVNRITAAIAAALKAAAPAASDYVDAQAAALDAAMATYRGLVAQIGQDFTDVPIGATESIVAEMASATRLQLISPPAFMDAIAEGNEPTARDTAQFQNLLTSRSVRVLIYNTQTVTTLTDTLQSMALKNGIPTVGVSETMPTGAQTFQGWQASQLELVRRALSQG